MYAESSGFVEGDIARMLSPPISGTANTCTTVRFYVNTYGADVGTLNMYLVGDEPYYFVSPIWQRKEISDPTWVEQELTLIVAFDYTVGFTVCYNLPLPVCLTKR